MTALQTLRRTAAATVAVASLSLAFAAAQTSATTVPPGDEPAADAPAGECAGVDAAAVADLPVHEAAAQLEDLSIFTAAIAASSLSDQLAGAGPFTIFAPSNAAMSEIPTNVLDSLLADPDLLDSILSYHIVVGEALPSHMLFGDVETLNGTLTISVNGDTVVINGGAATVVCPDIITADATIHVIDHVLQPADEMACPGGTSVPGNSTPDSSVPMASVPGSSVPC